jgi:hypothetical protein
MTDLPQLPASYSEDNSSMVILVSSGVIACLTLCCITAICIFRPGDNTSLITMITGFAVTATTSIAALIKVSGMGVKVDGKMEQLLQLTAARATLAEDARHKDMAKPPELPGTTTTTTTFEPPKP